MAAAILGVAKASVNPSLTLSAKFVAVAAIVHFSLVADVVRLQVLCFECVA
jgi:hypothetical protein